MTEKRRQRLDILTATDRPFRERFGSVAGMDEVGRGPLAGPVVAVCVVMPSEPVLEWVDDSKKLSETRREKVYEEICRLALFIGIGRAEPEEIDEVNILNATRNAMRRAAEGCPAAVVLVDAVEHLGLPMREEAIIHGDALSYSIAAASIVAKVARDREMREMDARYPEYGFLKNKGYATGTHIEALRAVGPCPLHRRGFIKNFV